MKLCGIVRTMSLMIVLGALAATSGCAGLQAPKPKTHNIEKDQTLRKEEVTEQFEQKRDFAQFEAAMGRWRVGDAKGCREQIEKLLARNPGHVEGGLMLAELMLLEDNPAAAMSRVKQTLEEHPENARAQHTMGLLLDAQGQTVEAQAYFQKAIELDPKNEVYTLSYETSVTQTQR
jgi:predicted Zn-dependent protease